MKLSIKSLDTAIQNRYGVEMPDQYIDFDRELSLQFGEIDIVEVECDCLSGGGFKFLDELVHEGSAMV
jgi:hypothetical protein